MSQIIISSTVYHNSNETNGVRLVSLLRNHFQFLCKHLLLTPAKGFLAASMHLLYSSALLLAPKNLKTTCCVLEMTSEYQFNTWAQWKHSILATQILLSLISLCNIWNSHVIKVIQFECLRLKLKIQATRGLFLCIVLITLSDNFSSAVDDSEERTATYCCVRMR